MGNTNRTPQPGIGYYNAPYGSNYPYEGIENYGSYYGSEIEPYGSEFYSTTPPYLTTPPRRLNLSQPGINRYGMLYPGINNGMFPSAVSGRPKVRVLFVPASMYNTLLMLNPQNGASGLNPISNNSFPMNGNFGNLYGNYGLYPNIPQNMFGSSSFPTGFSSYPVPCPPPMIQPVMFPSQTPWSPLNSQMHFNPGLPQPSTGFPQYPNVLPSFGTPSMGPMFPGSSPMAFCASPVSPSFNPVQSGMNPLQPFFSQAPSGILNGLPAYGGHGIYGNQFFGQNPFPNSFIQPGLSGYSPTNYNPYAGIPCTMQPFSGQPGSFNQIHPGFGPNNFYGGNQQPFQNFGYNMGVPYGQVPPNSFYPNPYSGGYNPGFSSSSMLPNNGLGMYSGTPCFNHGNQPFPAPFPQCPPALPYGFSHNQPSYMPPNNMIPGLNYYGHQSMPGYGIGQTNHLICIPPVTGTPFQGHIPYPNIQQPSVIPTGPSGNINYPGQPSVNPNNTGIGVNPQPPPVQPIPNTSLPPSYFVHPGPNNITNPNHQTMNGIFPNCPGRVTLVCCAVPQ